MRIILTAFLLFTHITIFAQQAQNKWLLKKGTIAFTSDAPLELIKASSNALKGIIIEDNLSFAFSVSNNSFQGFNSALQREHFNENYMESAKFPLSIFKGKIVEQINFSNDGVYEVRTKGKISIHGVEKERIIKSTITIKNNKLIVHSEFTVLLADHDISIPRVVYQKIAEEIKVEVNATFER